MNYVVLLAAGRSTRLGFDKILTSLVGKKVIEYSLETFLNSKFIDGVVVVTRKDIFSQIEEVVKSKNTTKDIRIIEGGTERQDSVANGLQHVPEAGKIVLIHDAARPLVTEEMIQKSIELCKNAKAVVCAQRATDTLKRADQNAIVEETLDRSKIWLMQTPQVFDRKLITEAYQFIQKNKFPITDDASAVEQLGQKVHLLESSTLNLKITREADWKILELWLGKRDEEIKDMIHKLNNLAGPIIGYLPLIEKYGSEDPKFSEYINKMKDGASQFQGLLKELQLII
jgi:2-C-methyl-D-erythritol 4-phosphate cytidylyltransferase